MVTGVGVSAAQGRDAIKKKEADVNWVAFTGRGGNDLFLVRVNCVCLGCPSCRARCAVARSLTPNPAADCGDLTVGRSGGTR